jgi:subtilisin family serine protease
MLPKSPSERPDNIAEVEWEGEQAQIYTDRIVVKLARAPGEQESVESIASDISEGIPGGQVSGRPSATGRIVFSVEPGTDIGELARRLSERDDIEWAEPDVVDRAQLIPSDPRFAQQWGPTKVRLPAAWDLVTGTTNVVIGVIDSGISMAATGGLNHPDLDDASRYLLGTDFVDGGTPRDLNGHGTHVAGIAAAEGNNAIGVSGANWGSRVYVCRTLDASGNGSASNFASAVEEITDWAVAHSMHAVINYSGGGVASATKHGACQYASDHGMILCAAAGNDNGGPIIFPAAYAADFDGVIAVGSTDSADAVSSFSNVGPELTVVAPGSGILSTMPTYAVTIPAALDYDMLSGTSMATPLVTGVAALMWSRHPGFTNKHIRDCLTQTAVKLGAGSFDNTWGHGRIDADAAVRCGDFFTLFTRFTFTHFTIFTPFTLFTPFTRFTFTRFTRFTPFTEFTFGPGWGWTGPGPIERREPQVLPFIRFAGALLDPAQLNLAAIAQFAEVSSSLSEVGLTRADELASTDPHDLGLALGIEQEEAETLVGGAQNILRQLASQ